MICGFFGLFSAIAFEIKKKNYLTHPQVGFLGLNFFFKPDLKK
jgi:hypothetical protein